MYRIDNEGLLLDWLAHESDPGERQRMLDWMATLADDPLAHAHRVPGIRAPVYLVVTPVRRVTLTFLCAREYNVIKLIEWGSLP